MLIEIKDYILFIIITMESMFASQTIPDDKFLKNPIP